jgi:hypothetical protein
MSPNAVPWRLGSFRVWAPDGVPDADPGRKDSRDFRPTSLHFVASLGARARQWRVGVAGLAGCGDRQRRPELLVTLAVDERRWLAVTQVGLRVLAIIVEGNHVLRTPGAIDVSLLLDRIGELHPPLSVEAL